MALWRSPVFRRGCGWPLLAELRPQGVKCPAPSTPHGSLCAWGFGLCRANTSSPSGCVSCSIRHMPSTFLHVCSSDKPHLSQLGHAETQTEYHPSCAPRVLPHHVPRAKLAAPCSTGDTFLKLHFPSCHPQNQRVRPRSLIFCKTPW